MYNVYFIDYSKAFDTVKHEPLIELLHSLDTDTQDINLLVNLYWNQKDTVRQNGELSESSSKGFVRNVLFHLIYLLCIQK